MPRVPQTLRFRRGVSTWRGLWKADSRAPSVRAAWSPSKDRVMANSASSGMGSLSRALKGPVLLLLLLLLLLLFVSLLRSLLLLLLLILLRPSRPVRPRGGPGLGSTPEINNNISTTMPCALKGPGNRRRGG